MQDEGYNHEAGLKEWEEGPPRLLSAIDAARYHLEVADEALRSTIDVIKDRRNPEVSAKMREFDEQMAYLAGVFADPAHPQWADFRPTEEHGYTGWEWADAAANIIGEIALEEGQQGGGDDVLQALEFRAKFAEQKAASDAAE